MSTKLIQQDFFLFSLMQKGDETAFDFLFKSYYSGLCVYAEQFLGDLSDAEEVVQSVFVKFWERRENIQIKVSLREYLFKIVYNKCLDFIKHEKVRRNYADKVRLQPIPEFNISDTNNFLEFEIRGIFNETMELLPPECKKVFMLSRIQNLKNREIAEKLGLSIKTVENQIGKALKIFRVNFKDYLTLLIPFFITRIL